MERCKLPRRLAAMFYDSLLLFSVLFVATAAILPLTQGEAISDDNIFYFLYLLSISYLYFTWQWTRGGQTLGMRSWKIRLQEFEKTEVSWKRASLRFFIAIPSVLFFAIGLIFSLLNSENLSLHDRFSKTHLILKRKMNNS